MSDEPLIVDPVPAEPLAGIPVLPLRDVVVYPHMVIPLFVGREKSIVALDQAMRTDKRILLVAQKQADVDDPKASDLYPVGTVATILHLSHAPFVLGVLSIVIFLAKVILMLFFFMWVRWTVPRFRYDQVMKLGWQKLLPLAIVNLLVYAIGFAVFQ